MSDQFALIRAGLVHNVIVAGPEFVAQIAPDWDHVQPLAEPHDAGLPVGIGWGFVDGAFVPPEEAEPVTVQRHVSQLAFLSRFTDAEAIGLDLASIGATVEAASLRRYQAKVQAAKFIDLDMPDTRAGVQALEAFGLLAPGRALEILDSPVQAGERP